LNLVPEPPPPAPPPPRPVAITRTPVAHVAAKKLKPIVKVEAKVEPKPPEPPKPDPATQKRGVDSDIYATPSAKRSLDSNVLDGSATSKPAIDRDNPWQR
jgi:hypothetical protein